jgi:hypothetical protein
MFWSFDVNISEQNKTFIKQTEKLKTSIISKNRKFGLKIPKNQNFKNSKYEIF